MAGLSDTMPWLVPARAALAALHGRGAHALLLHGPAGAGKWELAMGFARDVLCESARPPARACGACPSCLLFAAGNHPDLRVVVPDIWADRRPGGSDDEEGAQGGDATEEGGEAAVAGTQKRVSKEIKIDQVRVLAQLTSVSAHRGGHRVIILAPAEALNASAANALLKGLEEPPPASVFLLASDHVDRCLPTILSRCAQVRVPLPPEDLALSWLQEQGVESGALGRLRDVGGGPLSVLRGAAGGLEEEHRDALLGMLRRGAALTPAQVVAGVPRTLPLAPAVALFQRWGWDFFSYRMGGALRYHPQDTASFAALASAWSVAAAGAWLDRMRELQRVAEHPLNARTAVEGALLDYIGSVAEGAIQHRERHS